jgi:hypothetical protein
VTTTEMSLGATTEISSSFKAPRPPTLTLRQHVN